MVVGEEFVIGKAIDALVSWFNKKKKQKKEVHEILMAVKIGLNNIPLHMDLSIENGRLKHSNLRMYLPSDIEYINQLLIKYQSLLDCQLYDELIKFLKFLTQYNGKLASAMPMGRIVELREKEVEIKNSIRTFISKIDDLIKEIE